jgi:hypothetical protein
MTLVRTHTSIFLCLTYIEVTPPYLTGNEADRAEHTTDIHSVLKHRNRFSLSLHTVQFFVVDYQRFGEPYRLHLYSTTKMNTVNFSKIW